MGIEIDLRIQQCAGKLRGVSYRSLPGQLSQGSKGSSGKARKTA